MVEQLITRAIVPTRSFFGKFLDTFPPFLLRLLTCAVLPPTITTAIVGEFFISHQCSRIQLHFQHDSNNMTRVC